MAFSHSYQSFIPSTIPADPHLPRRLKPIEAEGLVDPGEEEESRFDDLIMLAEFSEKEGPRPLIILSSSRDDGDDGGGDIDGIAEDAAEDHRDPVSSGHNAAFFDANAFAVRIMSVDASAPPTIGAPKEESDGGGGGSGSGVETHFRLASDSIVIHLETEEERVVSHVHHFTLYDLDARGFVRPFCVAYVTRKKEKLVRRHGVIDAKFKQATDAFKMGNFLQFSRELQKRLVDLGYTKGRMIEWNQVHEFSTEKSPWGQCSILLVYSWWNLFLVYITSYIIFNIFLMINQLNKQTGI